MEENRQIYLAARPVGMPRACDFAERTAPIPQPGPEEVLVRIAYMSVDPYMRGHIDGNVYRSMKPLQIGDTMYGGAVGRVIASRSPSLAQGDVVEGYLGWQAYAAVAAATVRKVNPLLAPISTALGVLGMPGMTAYFGVTDVARPKAGETFVVSAAAGAVGSAAGQIARILGCRVVGIAGGQAKVAHLLDELGFDAAIDYKDEPDLHAALVASCPNKIDVYFDNVGGNTYDAVARWMNDGCRYIICGSIAQYNEPEADVGPRHLKRFEVARARMQGFGVLEYRPRYDEGIAQMAAWIASGKLRYRESIVDGLEHAPAAFIALLNGKNLGKQIVRVSGD